MQACSFQNSPSGLFLFVGCFVEIEEISVFVK
jgi:hypothetical protein